MIKFFTSKAPIVAVEEKFLIDMHEAAFIEAQKYLLSRASFFKESEYRSEKEYKIYAHELKDKQYAERWAERKVAELSTPKK